MICEERRCRREIQTALLAKLRGEKSMGRGRGQGHGKVFAEGRVLKLSQFRASLLATHLITPALFQNYTCQGDCLSEFTSWSGLLKPCQNAILEGNRFKMRLALEVIRKADLEDSE